LSRGCLSPAGGAGPRCHWPEDHCWGDRLGRSQVERAGARGAPQLELHVSKTGTRRAVSLNGRIRAPMDPVVTKLEEETLRRRRRAIFKKRQVPVRLLIPNFFTLLGLCAGDRKSTRLNSSHV